MEKNNKENLTKEQVVERLNDNFEVIETSLGTVNFNKKFFIGCGICSLCATGLGIAGMIITGGSIPTIAVSLFSVGSAVLDGILVSREYSEEERLLEAQENNSEVMRKVIAKK